MFNFRAKYEYEDLDDEQQLSPFTRRSRSIAHIFMVTICAVGIVCGFFVLCVSYSAFFHEVEQRDSIVLAAEAANSSTQDVPQILVTIEQGELEGTRLQTRAGREFLGFMGIPYAKPPLGSLRFQPPVEPSGWNGTLNATEFKPWCIQRRSHTSPDSNDLTVGSEDCLYINVFTPKTIEDLGRRRQRSKLPVMAYVHGGIGGAFGNINRNGAQYLLDEDVILVTFHYRLGALGNLNTNDSFATGNQALKDQVMALKWVKNNIAKFGGDSKRVTLFGESYGAMSICAHLISPMSTDLFQRAIIQSGTIIDPGIIQRNTVEKAFTLGSKLNCTYNSDPSNTGQLISCLKNVTAEDIVLQALEEPLGSMEFTMSIDDTFLPDFPMKLYQNSSSNVHSMPIAIGVTSAELVAQSLVIVSSPELTNLFNNNWTQIAVSQLSLDLTSDQTQELASSIRDFYLGEFNVSKETERNVTYLFSDRSFVHPASVTASFQFESNNKSVSSNSRGQRGSRGNSNSNVYLYIFNYPADVSYADKIIDNYESDEFLGVSHADELQFLFPYEPFPLIPEGHKDANFSKMMCRLWTSFADTGIPEGATNGESWLPIDGSKPYNWFQIEEEPKMVNDSLLNSRMKFWDSIDLNELYI